MTTMLTKGWLIWVLPDAKSLGHGEAELLPLQWAPHRELVLLPDLAVDRIEALRKKHGGNVRFLPMGVYTESERLFGATDDKLPPKYEKEIQDFLARTRP